MHSKLPLGDGLKDDLIRVFCYVGLLFTVFFLYLDWRYHLYIEDYRDTQRQEEQIVNKKITATLGDLRALAEALRAKILATPEDPHSIQIALKAGQLLSEEYKIPTLQNISYYKLSHPQGVITPILIASLKKLPQAFRKPVKELTALTYQNNAMVGTLPLLDKNKRLKGILEIKVSSLDLQKIMGADHFKTLEFPQLFGTDGAKFVQDKPLAFTYKRPLSYLAYLSSYVSHFWVLDFAVLVGGFLIFFSGRVAKRRVGFVYGSQLGQMSNQLNSLKTRSSFQHSRIQQHKELSGAFSKTVNFLKQSGRIPAKNQVLLNAVAEIAEDLSTGIGFNHKREPLNLKSILDQVVMYFLDQIQKLNLNVRITCPEELTFIGDPHFVRMILLNIVGSPLFCLPKKGEMSISATKMSGFIYIEIHDNRYSLSEIGKKYVKISHDLFVEDQKLQQICLQNRIGYSLSQSEKGEFTTKVSFPLELDIKTMAFPYQESTSIH